MLQGMPAAKGLFHRAIIMSTLADTAISGLEPHERSKPPNGFSRASASRKSNADKLQTMTQERNPHGADRRRRRRWPGRRRGAGGRLSLQIVPVKDGRRSPCIHSSRSRRRHRATSRSCADRTRPKACRTATRRSVLEGRDHDRRGAASPRQAIVPVDDAEADRLIALYRKNRPQGQPRRHRGGDGRRQLGAAHSRRTPSPSASSRRVARRSTCTTSSGARR